MAEEWANKISTKGHISFAEISGIFDYNKHAPPF
jgi:hypothetical protein